MTVAIKTERVGGPRAFPDNAGIPQSVTMVDVAGVLTGFLTTIKESFRLYRVTAKFADTQSGDIKIIRKSRFGPTFDSTIKTVEFSVTPGKDFYFAPDNEELFFNGDEIELTGTADEPVKFVIDYGQIQSDTD